MNQMIFVAIGGFFGAISRFAVSRIIRHKSGFPLATLTVNLLGAFLLGLLIGTPLKGNFYAFAGIGFMGSFTTFSTFKLEIVRLQSAKKRTLLYSYLAISYIGGITLAYIGLLIGRGI